MLETLPKLEEHLLSALTQFIEAVARKQSPVAGEIQRLRIAEGRNSVTERPDGTVDNVPFRKFSTESSLKRETLLYSPLDEIFLTFVPAGESLARDQERMLYETIEKVTEETGNVVDGRGQPLSYDFILASLEQIQIDFDESGNPKMPTLVVNPKVAERLRELDQSPEKAAFEKSLKELMSKKWVMWREREADRILVG